MSTERRSSTGVKVEEEFTCCACGGKLESAWDLAVHTLLMHVAKAADPATAAYMRRVENLALEALCRQVPKNPRPQDRV